MTTRKAWFDGEHEGKLLRYGINKLAKQLRKAEDSDEIIKLLNAIGYAANAKQNIAKQQLLDGKVTELLKLIKEQNARKIFVDNQSHELPRKQD